jgi:tRNA 2-thiocytidine biosynthesis protein TtcA
VTGLETRQKLDTLERRLLNDVGRCAKEHALIQEGDRVMVAVSGGKDSYTLLHLLRKLKARSPVPFELMAVTLDQGQPGFESHRIEAYMADEGIPFKLLRQDTYSVVLEKVREGKTFCSLCSRMRRGVLYRAAGEMGFNKIALGHHRDDLIETLLLNVLYAGQIKAMPARLKTDDGRFDVIRPMALVPEARIIEFAELMDFPILPCNLCGSQDGLHRQKIKQLLADLSAENPAVKGNVLASLGQVIPSHLLDRGLMDRLQAGAGAD